MIGYLDEFENIKLLMIFEKICLGSNNPSNQSLFTIVEIFGGTAIKVLQTHLKIIYMEMNLANISLIGSENTLVVLYCIVLYLFV